MNIYFLIICIIFLALYIFEKLSKKNITYDNSSSGDAASGFNHGSDCGGNGGSFDCGGGDGGGGD